MSTIEALACKTAYLYAVNTLLSTAEHLLPAARGRYSIATCFLTLSERSGTWDMGLGILWILVTIHLFGGRRRRRSNEISAANKTQNTNQCAKPYMVACDRIKPLELNLQSLRWPVRQYCLTAGAGADACKRG